LTTGIVIENGPCPQINGTNLSVAENYLTFLNPLLDVITN